MNTELVSRIKEWVEFQQRSCIDAPYSAKLLAYELKTSEDDILMAIKQDDYLMKVVSSK